MEAAGLAGFMIGASLLTTLLEHPDSPIQQLLGQQPTLRRVPLSLVLGGYIAGFIYSSWGRQSGAHLNPAMTWAFFRLGKIRFADALWYMLAQFTGAIAAAQLMKLLLGKLYAYPSVNYAATVPSHAAHATAQAFAAEFIISFVMLFVMLVAINSRRLERLAGLLAGLLIGLFLLVETPYSGMSMNSARTFGSAFAAWHWRDLWIYFTAPPLAMLLAAEIFRRWKRQQVIACAKLWHSYNRRCIFCDQQAGPHYPVNEAAA